MIRNNTDFYVAVKNYLSSIEHLKDEPLQYHQLLTKKYVTESSNIKGILAYYNMGGGKTILSISIAYEMLKTRPNMRVIFIAPKSLHANFKMETYKYLDKIGDEVINDFDNYFYKHFKLVSLNASNMLTQVFNAARQEGEDIFVAIEKNKKNIEKINKFGNLNNTLVIIDEAHNFFNSVTNGSDNAIGLYKLLLNAVDNKVIFLTGSPIINDPFEIVVPMNILGSSKNNMLFGDNYQKFTEYFVDNKKPFPMLKNKEKFTNRITGLVSYFDGKTEEFSKKLPKKLKLIIEKIPMSDAQYKAYMAARTEEIEEENRQKLSMSKFKKRDIPSMSKSAGNYGSSYRVATRQIGNFMFPKNIGDIKDNIIPKKELSNIDDTILDNMSIYSSKIIAIVKNLSMHLPENNLPKIKKDHDIKKFIKQHDLDSSWTPGIGLGLVYSQFITSGLGILAKYLEYKGMTEIKNIPIDKNKNGNFAIISGDMDTDTRTDILKVAFSKENINCEYISLLLVSSTGAEGINAKRIRHEHIMEPYWHLARHEQFYARGIRPDSHAELPEKERTVQLYLYLSDYPKKRDDNTDISEPTTDIYLYTKAVRSQILINSFLRAIKETSIDCFFHSNDSLSCKLCMPTNKKLFLDNLQDDISTASPCKPMEEEEIKAKPITITVNGEKKEFMYAMEGKTIHIFEYDKTIDGYKEIFYDHPHYADIIKLF